MNGTFISFEGPDGSGKTSTLNGVLQQLQGNTVTEPIVTREPGGSAIAEKIRHIILDPTNKEMDVKTEALLFAAARRQHVVEVIQPALARGEILISDRFVDSSLAYQGGGREIGIDPVRMINNFATDNLQPDLTIYLDVDSSVGLARISASRSGTEDRLEQEKIDFHKRVTSAYHELISANPERIIPVDANQELAKVIADSVKIIRERLPQIFR